MDCASFFEIPSLTSIVIESLQIELDMENVCDVLSRMTLAQSPLRARCMQLYMENPDVFAQHCHEQRLRPTLQREIYALKKALSETTASDWKFSKESYPSSYKENVFCWKRNKKFLIESLLMVLGKLCHGIVHS